MSTKGFVAVLGRLKLLTQTTSDSGLAKVLGVSPQTLSSWKVRSSIPYSFCVDLALQHGVSLDWLLLGEGPRQRLSALAPLLNSDHWESDLLASVRSLSRTDQQAIALVVRDKQRIRQLEQQLAELREEGPTGH